MTTTRLISDEHKQTQRLLIISKIIFLFIIIYSLWIALIIIGIYFFELKSKWAILPVDQWILSAIILISIAIALEFILLIYYNLSKQKYLQDERQPTCLQGKLVHNYTIPNNAKGGIFCKTYVIIDENHILNLRYQMILPSELWKQK